MRRHLEADVKLERQGSGPEDGSLSDTRPIRTISAFISILKKGMELFRNRLIIMVSKTNKAFRTGGELRPAMHRKSYSEHSLLFGEYTRNPQGNITCYVCGA
jgi:hypothetical protein